MLRLSSLLRGGVVQQQLDGGLDYLDELPLIVLSSCRSWVCNGVHVIHDRIHRRNNRTSAGDRALNPCLAAGLNSSAKLGSLPAKMRVRVSSQNIINE